MRKIWTKHITGGRVYRCNIENCGLHCNSETITRHYAESHDREHSAFYSLSSGSYFARTPKRHDDDDDVNMEEEEEEQDVCKYENFKKTKMPFQLAWIDPRCDRPGHFLFKDEKALLASPNCLLLQLCILLEHIKFSENDRIGFNYNERRGEGDYGGWV